MEPYYGTGASRTPGRTIFRSYLQDQADLRCSHPASLAAASRFLLW